MFTNYSEHQYRLFLSALPCIGPKRFETMLRYFGTAEATWHAAQNDLQSCLTPAVIRTFVEQRKELKPGKLLQDIQTLNLRTVDWNDHSYPELLKEIYDPPPLLYIAGILPTATHVIGIVGSRKATPYGKRITERIVSQLGNEYVVITGLAYGIDTAAHEACTKQHIPSIGILAGGHAAVTGREYKLAKAIIANGGAIISEHPPQTTPHKQFFPIRNRIISGMSHGTIIVEATEKSGSLITARSALAQNRDVFAVPGPIDSPYSAGTNQLIVEGAIPCIRPQCIPDYFGSTPIQNHTYTAKNDTEQLIINAIKEGKSEPDGIIEQTGLDASTVLQTLTELELVSAIHAQSDGSYSL